MVEMKRAILSVSDKTGLAQFAQRLTQHGYELVSTGGTLRTLSDAGLQATPIHEVTGFPEAFGGRVKTLHPVVHGGILFRRGDPGDEKTREELGIAPVDLVIVNLYPFRDTISTEGVTVTEAVEQIDIGGLTLVRAAAKNFESVGVVVDPADYDEIVGEIEQTGALSRETRSRLARKAFEHTAAYDSSISGYFRSIVSPDDGLPQRQTLSLQDGSPLRYGENPHQEAILYGSDAIPKLGGGRVLQGKELSYNNIVDADAALAAVREFDVPTAVIVKHTNPCGVGWDRDNLADAFVRAVEGDPQSAFGGIVALNRPCEVSTAELIARRFFEVVLAPDFTDEALVCLKRKKSLRLLAVNASDSIDRVNAAFRWTSLGVLSQSVDRPLNSDSGEEWRVATHEAPSDEAMAALQFLWRVCKHVKSNAIVVGSQNRTHGVGAGQMSRVDSVRIALEKAGADGESKLCLASDAFFPFRDNIDVAAAGGVRAIVQPGGSKRDQEVIDACNEHGIAMVFTGHRHFKH